LIASVGCYDFCLVTNASGDWMDLSSQSSVIALAFGFQLTGSVMNTILRLL